MAAGVAALRLLTPDRYDALEATSARLEAGLRAAAAAAGRAGSAHPGRLAPDGLLPPDGATCQPAEEGVRVRPRRVRSLLRGDARCRRASSPRRSSRPGSCPSPTATPRSRRRWPPHAARSRPWRPGLPGRRNWRPAPPGAGTRPRPPPRLPPPAGRRDAGVVHAPGGPVASRISRDPRATLFEVAATPELCAEVTLQPVRRHDVDAAVMFADIMTPVLRHGHRRAPRRGRRPGDRRARSARSPTSSGCGPRSGRGVPARPRRGAFVRRCVPIRPSSASAAARSPSPGTSSRGPSREFALTKSMMLGEPETCGTHSSTSCPDVRRLRRGAGAAGADVIQLFDSWVGALSPSHYRDGSPALGPCSRLAASTCRRSTSAPGPRLLALQEMAGGGDVIGLDWRIPLVRGAQVARPGRPGQPRPRAARPWEVVEESARILARRPAGPATSSTSVTASSRPSPTRSRGSSTSSTSTEPR